MTLWALMFPFDVVKSRAQVQGTGGKSMLGLLMHIGRTEGESFLCIVSILNRICRHTGAVLWSRADSRTHILRLRCLICRI